MSSLAKCPTHGLWRKSASLLLVGPGKHGRPSVLMVKRSSRATFMPNHIVFPGGLCEPSDFSLTWRDNFPDFNHFTVASTATYPDIFVNDCSTNPPEFKELSPHVGFRISAIRELVEETGLFLDKNSGVRSLSETVRKRVHTDPTQFCSIVKNLGLHPDISSLHDWSTWLTPTGLKHSSRRYDTHFYIAVVDSLEDVHPISDDTEVSSVQFWDVSNILQSAIMREVIVAPPQMYELLRILNFTSIDEVRDYTKLRDAYGTERLFPVIIKCRDGQVNVLPGDSLYPDFPDITGNRPLLKLDMTVEDCMKKYPNHHRVNLTRDKPYTLVVNVKLNLNQQAPVTASNVSRKSQL